MTEEIPEQAQPALDERIENQNASMLSGDKTNLVLHEALEPHRATIEATVKPYVRISAMPGETQPWESKLGGTPYLLKEAPYPEDCDGKPMRLLAQINFSELPATENFPKEGLLQFFISPEDELMGFNYEKPLQQDHFKVVFIPTVQKDETLLRKDFSFLKPSEDMSFPVERECQLQFDTAYAPVGLQDYRFPQLMGKDPFAFFEVFGDRQEMLYQWYDANFPATGHRMGGYSFFTQEDPRYYGDKAFDTQLLQIDSDMDMGILWGDSGVANFLIKGEELARRDFSNVYYTWDCY